MYRYNFRYGKYMNWSVFFTSPSTVNVVIFAGGKFRENVSKTFHVGVIFPILLLFPSERHMGFIFAWGLFSRRRQKREKRENYPHAKISTFTVYE